MAIGAEVDLMDQAWWHGLVAQCLSDNIFQTRNDLPQGESRYKPSLDPEETLRESAQHSKREAPDGIEGSRHQASGGAS